MEYIIQELHETIVDQAIEIKNLKEEINYLRTVISESDTEEVDTTRYIYESPDNGKTIFRRVAGEPVSSREQITEEELPSYQYFADSTNTLNIP